MSKKIILPVVVAAIVGSVTSYSVTKFTENQQNAQVIETTGVKSSDSYTFASNPMQHTETSFPDLTYAAENTVPAVVNIENKKIVEQSNPYYGGGYDMFYEFFGIPQQGRGQSQGNPQQRESRSGGSGVIISKDGYIITNNHVIEDATELKVTLSDERSYPAKLIGTDPTTDIALIKIEADDLPTIPFGDSEKLRLGEWVIAVGNPYSLNSTVTAGIVSAKGRNLDVIPSQFRIESFIQTDAAVNPGNSGGALVNTKGELVGINTVIKSSTGSYIGYSFAVPSTIVKKVIVDLKEYGIVQRAMLGLGYNEINDAFLESQGKELGITEKGGLYIGTVDPNGAAYDAGIQVGDILIEINGVKTTNSAQLQGEIAKFRPNEKVEISVKRDGKVKHFEVLLRNKAGETKLLEKNSVDMVAFLGGQFQDLSEKQKKSLEIDNGVQVIKVGNGMLAKAGIKEGYIITHINGRAIRTVSDLDRLTQKVQNIDGLYPNGRYVSYSVINE
ncbi:MAG: Do family serine endopeptidase [Rikenellaceae bacterium]